MSATLKVPHEMRDFDTHTPTIIGRIGRALREAYAGRHAAKRLATDAHNSPRTAEAWLYGRNVPPSPELIRLMAVNESLEKEIISMVHAMRENG